MASGGSWRVTPAVAMAVGRVPGCVRALMLALALLAVEGLPEDELHEITDVWADIDDLDVGDLEDPLSDVPLEFAMEVQKRQHRPSVPKLQDMQDMGSFHESTKDLQQMSIAALRQDLSEKLDKPGTEERAAIWKTLLETGGVKAQLHVVDPGKILFVTRRQEMHDRIKEFVLSQPETDWWEYKQKKFFPEGRDGPLLSHEDRTQREIELGWREKPLPRPTIGKVIDTKETKKKKKRRKSDKGTDKA